MSAAQLSDEALFKQPPRGDECPICLLLLPSRLEEIAYQACCGKNICQGCVHQMMAIDTNKCPLCREPVNKSDKEWVARCNKRMEAGDDANAFQALGQSYFVGSFGLPKDPKKGFELYSRAAELGSASGHYSVGIMYYNGKGVERDLIKAEYHYQQAAMLGSRMARYNLGCYEYMDDKGNTNRAVKHWIIAAGSGDQRSLDTVRDFCIKGSATKADYEKALRDYQKYMDEATSAQRNRAAGRCIADDERELANLAQWVNTQRKEYKENKLSVAQIKQLNDMGFEWSAGGMGR